jgi:hypothetical protein
MQKTPFQIIVSLLVFIVFLWGTYLLLPVVIGVLGQAASGALAMNLNTVLMLLLYVLFSLVQVMFLLASIQIFKTGEVSMLRKLLWLSVPTFNIMGFVAYQFAFGPYVFLNTGIHTAPFNLMFDFSYHTFAVLYNLSFSTENTHFLSVGINVVPLIFLNLLKRFGR